MTIRRLHMSKNRSEIAFAVGLSIFSPIVCGQSTSAAGKSVQESVSVSLVQVPVVVVDGAGAPLEGLTAADFEVRDNGRPVKDFSVDVFDFRPASRPPDAGRAAPPPTMPPVARRKFVLLVDLTYANARALSEARRAAISWVQSDLAANDLMALATVSVQHGIQIAHDFTGSRDELFKTLESMPFGNSIDRPSDPLSGFAPGTGDRGDGIQLDILAASHLDDNSYRIGRIETLLAGLQTLAHALARIPGRKYVLYLSRGFDFRLASGFSGRVNQNSVAVMDAAAGRDSDETYGSTKLQRRMEETFQTFRDANAAVYAIDMGGLTTNTDASLDVNSRNLAEGYGRGSLAAVAENTGGELLENSNDYAHLLSRVARSTALEYVLNIPGPTTGRPGRAHRLKIKVRRKGARVFGRQEYTEMPPG
jgi:VWFA-related protein